MSIFDVFTGSSAKKAAAANKAEFERYGTEATGALDKGMAGSLPAVNEAIGAYTRLNELGAKYARGTDLYMDALGINGAEGNERAVAGFRASPGYEFATNEAIDRAQRAGARFSPGGNEIDAITRLAHGLGDQEWSNYLGRLGGFMPQEANAIATGAAGQAAGYGAKAGLYSTDAQNRVNVFGNRAGGIANSNTAAAKAQMDASGNFWNAYLAAAGNAAKASSDRRLKTEIVRVGDDPRGFGRYRYRYLWDEPGVQRHGYMADEVERVRPDAVSRDSNGFAVVDYGALEI